MPSPTSASKSGITLLIDLDGTLVDTAPDLTAALNAVLEEEGLPPLSETTVRQLVGRGAPRLIEHGLEVAGARPDPARLPKRVRRFLDIYEIAPAARSRPYPGVAATLARWAAAGHTLSVCTNKPQVSSEAVLRALDLADFFTTVGGGDRFPVRKPDDGHLHATLALTGGDAARTVMIGDSRTDLEAARAAEIPVVLVDYGYSNAPARTLGADAVAARFDALPELVASLLPGAAAA